MRGVIGRKIPSSTTFAIASCRNSLVPFSTSSPSNPSGGGGGRGRGGGGGGGGGGSSSTFDFVADRPVHDESSEVAADPPPFPTGLGRGHGRGKPLPSSPGLPSFNTFVSSTGRGGPGPSSSAPPPPQPSIVPKKPVFFKKEDGPPNPRVPEAVGGGSGDSSSSRKLPANILSALSRGVGRGKAVLPCPESPPVREENRHLRMRPAAPSWEEGPRRAAGREEGDRGLARGRGRGLRGRGRGRGRGGLSAGGGRGFYRERGETGRFDDAHEGYGAGLYLGNNADGEKLAQRLGPENMAKLAEAFEEMSDRVLPSPLDDIYLEGFHTNCLFEFEPEYMMAEFGTNPDIDEKPPIPLRDALEKMKPFLMVYEGIKSQEEWEEVMKETMDRVPLLKEIVDYYSGADVVTAKKQQEELERVAKTIPNSAPASVQRFANRAVLSLQSNPGWGFDKKCQFMDKLVWEVSQHCK